MILYKYRWLGVLCLVMMILVLGYLVDLRQEWAHLTELRNSQQNFINQLTHPALFDQSINPPHVLPISNHKKSVILPVAAILKLITISGLTINSIKPFHNKNSSSLLLQITVEGYFDQIIFFISMLEKNKVIKIMDFSCRLMHQNLLQMEMKIILPMLFIASTTPLSAAQYFSRQDNPFCTARDRDKTLFTNEVNRLQSFPLELLKMVGYLKQDSKVAALLLLPSHDLIMIKPGDILGKEQARVITIQPNFLQVQLQDSNKHLKIILHH